MEPRATQSPDDTSPDTDAEPEASGRADPAAGPREVGGPQRLEPTRYGDWEKNGRCIDF